MQDGCGRTIDYLRLSVTDRCNYRCRYCMPAEGVEKRAHGDILSLEELAEIAGAAVACGVKKIRLTGGEPLVRLGLGDHLDTILIGCIMLTIPGLAITNAIRDLLSGDTFSGLSRLCESLLLAAGIACGFSLAIYLMGRGL